MTRTALTGWEEKQDNAQVGVINTRRMPDAGCWTLRRLALTHPARPDWQASQPANTVFHQLGHAVSSRAPACRDGAHTLT